MPCQQNSARRMSLPALELVKKSIFDKLSNETHFVGLSFEKAAARRSAPVAHNSHVCEPRCIFSDAHVIGEND